MTEPLVINQFEGAIADSPHNGFALMKRVDLDEFPGAVKAKNGLSSLFPTAYSGNFTADEGTDVCADASFTGNANTTGTAVVLTTTGTLPAGLSLATTYFIIRVTQASGTFKLATTIANADAGTAIDITDAGSGTHTLTTRNPGTINHIIKEPNLGTRFFHDSNARVWYLEDGTSVCRLLNGNTLTNGNGNGIVTFLNSDASKTYLFVFRNALIDVIEVTAVSNLETPSWTSGWQTMNTAATTNNRHHAIVGQDNIIYYTDGKYIGSIKELTIFVPATGATYTWTSQALDTIQNEVLEHLEELGVNLLAAGGIFNKIYPWNRLDDSFNLPLQVPEKGVKRLKNIGNLIYILAGGRGNIYVTQGSYVKHFKKIPDQVANNSGTLQEDPVTWGGIDAVNGNLIFGASVLTSENSGAYMLYPDGRLVIDQIPLTAGNATAFEVSSNFYYIGYASGADEHTTSRYANFEAVAQSGWYRVATKTEKATYSKLEVVTAKPATSGSIRVSYRTDTSSAFTTIDTFTADSSTTVFQNDGIGLIDIENIHIQIEFHGTFEILEIRLL